MSPFTRALSPDEYPSRLRDLGTFPTPLYLTGELPTEFAVAVVGTRHPTAEARHFARVFARELAKKGVAVLSGGAAGIDTAAHEGALDAQGKTMVVAPAAFDRPFPDWNARLFERVVNNGGAYLTPFPPGTPATRAQFFTRNGLLAALSDALVVVESGHRGGARNAAKAARSLARRVFAVPGGPWNPMAAGCLDEIRLGASIVTSAHDLLVSLGRISPEPAERSSSDEDEAQLLLELPQSCSGDPERETVLSALRNGHKNLDELCALSGLPAGRLQGLILTLTLEGIVVSEPSGRIRLGNH